MTFNKNPVKKKRVPRKTAREVLEGQLASCWAELEKVRLRRDALEFVVRTAHRHSGVSEMAQPIFTDIWRAEVEAYKSLFMWTNLVPGASRKKAQTIAIKWLIDNRGPEGFEMGWASEETQAAVKYVREMVKEEQEAEAKRLEARVKKDAILDDKDLVAEVEGKLKTK